jgi:TatD DNase family protein
MAPVFYDTHAHLDYPEYAGDFTEMLARAHAAGIGRMITIGTDLESSVRAIKLAEAHAPIFAAIGWHPGNALEAPEDLRPALRELAQHPKVVALGETGLDSFRLPSASGGTAADDARYKAAQMRLFAQQLEVAAECGLNAVIHTRGECFEETLAQMAPFAGRVRGLFHCFVGDTAQMRRVLEIGSIVSFTGICTFKNGQTVRETIAATPLGQFMLETDAPYLAPVPYRGKRCEPAYVREIAETVAQVKGATLAELSAATCATAHDFFQKLTR